MKNSIEIVVGVNNKTLNFLLLLESHIFQEKTMRLRVWCMSSFKK